MLLRRARFQLTPAPRRAPRPRDDKIYLHRLAITGFIERWEGDLKLRVMRRLGAVEYGTLLVLLVLASVPSAMVRNDGPAHSLTDLLPDVQSDAASEEGEQQGCAFSLKGRP